MLKKWVIKATKIGIIFRTTRYLEFYEHRIDTVLRKFSNRYPKYLIEEIYVQYMKKN